MITLHFMEDVSVIFSSSVFRHINDYLIYDNNILHTFKFSKTYIYIFI